MKTRRYSVPCRSCNGSGFHRSEDGEGNAVLDSCDCYRGRVTILLTPDDERDLLRELQVNTGNPAVPA